MKEFYLGFMVTIIRDLLDRYHRAYPGAYAPKDYRDKLGERVERIRAQYGFKDHTSRRGSAPEPPGPQRRGPQLMLPI